MELVPREELSKMLKRKRQRIGVKQKKLASVAGLSPSHVNRIENDTTNPSYDSIYQLWKSLDDLKQEEARYAEDLMNTPVASASQDETLEEVTKKMRKNSFSQLPVIEEGSCKGRITESAIIEARNPDICVEEVMGPRMMEVQEDTSMDAVREILKDEPAVLVNDSEGEIEGIITKTDLL